MKVQTLDRDVLNVALSTKPPKHMRASTSRAVSFNKRRFYDACARRGADPVDILARIFSDDPEALAIPLDKRAELAIKALSWLDKQSDDEAQRATPRVEIVIIDPDNTSAGATQAPAALEARPI